MRARFFYLPAKPLGEALDEDSDTELVVTYPGPVVIHLYTSQATDPDAQTPPNWNQESEKTETGTGTGTVRKEVVERFVDMYVQMVGQDKESGNHPIIDLPAVRELPEEEECDFVPVRRNVCRYNAPLRHNVKGALPLNKTAGGGGTTILLRPKASFKPVVRTIWNPRTVRARAMKTALSPGSRTSKTASMDTKHKTALKIECETPTNVAREALAPVTCSSRSKAARGLGTLLRQAPFLTPQKAKRLGEAPIDAQKVLNSIKAIQDKQCRDEEVHCIVDDVNDLALGATQPLPANRAIKTVMRQANRAAQSLVVPHSREVAAASNKTPDEPKPVQQSRTTSGTVSLSSPITIAEKNYPSQDGVTSTGPKIAQADSQQ